MMSGSNSDHQNLPYIKSTENKSYWQANSAPTPTAVRGMAATVIQQAQRIPSKISFNRAYAVDLKTGVLRLVLIVFLTCGWISAAAVAKNAEKLKAYGDYSSTRTAYLFFSLFAFFVYLIIYLLNVLSIINMNKLRSLPWNLINLVFDVFFLITIFSCSVAAASRESQMNKSKDPFLLSITNRGAFGSAAAFGFMSCIIFIVFIVLWVMYMKKDETTTDPDPTSHTKNAVNATITSAGPGANSAMPNLSASSGIAPMPKVPSAQGAFKGFSSDDRTENI